MLDAAAASSRGGKLSSIPILAHLHARRTNWRKQRMRAGKQQTDEG
jgi:hypothetical protein